MVRGRPAATRKPRDADRSDGRVFYPDRDLPPSSLRLDEHPRRPRSDPRRQTRLPELALLPHPRHFLFRFLYRRDAALPALFDWTGSRRQSRVHDKHASARIHSAPPLGLSLTFGAYDWLLGVDYHWFSTMWGVYIFAGAA